MCEISKLIADFYKNTSYMKWEQLFNKDTLLGITKTDKYEESHSLIIRYILDPRERHGLGTKPLELFLRLLVIKNLENKTVRKYANDLLLKSNTFNVLISVPEKTDKKSRYDIYIEFEINNTKSTIIIENKVLSTENENQTKKYSEYAKDYQDPILVYLSNNDKCESPDFICITYQDLLEYVIEPLYYYVENETTKQLLKDYMRIISHIDTKEGSVTLAMSNEEKSLLRKIYNENQELFERMVEALTGDELTKEEKETYKKAIEISKNHRAKWSYKGKTMNSKELVLTIVREQLQNGKNIEYLSKFKMHSDPLVVAEERTKEVGYTMQELNGLVYYVRTCCDMKDVLNLIEALNIEVMKIER